MKGVLIVNLGTPSSASVKDVKAYLGEFLMDKYVLDMPYLQRLALVKGVILNTRPKKSSAVYQKIWTDEGSPLLFHSEKLTAKVQSKVDVPVVLAMRYNTPSIQQGLLELKQKGCTDVYMISLYPQYAMSSTVTVEEKVKEEVDKLGLTMKITFSKPFYSDKTFVKLLAEKIKEDMESSGANYLLFSYHSIPVHQLAKTGCPGSSCSHSINGSLEETKVSYQCYHHQCVETTKAVVKYLGLKKTDYEISYQSRLGRKEWITPSTADRLPKIAKEGNTKLLVTTPSFVSDCLETIEEIGMDGRQSFLTNGGEVFHRVECLNEDDNWVDLVVDWINEFKLIN